MAIHFEELWEKAENLHQGSISSETDASIAEELSFKIDLYRDVAKKEGIPETEKRAIQSRLMGEVLLTLTKLSLKDNVDVYQALSIAMQYRSIDHYAGKYST
jgi:hypothetical protein